MVTMQVITCALGVVQKRGNAVVDPAVVTLGPLEMDYLARHVTKVRETTSSGGRSLFIRPANTPTLLETLRTTASDPHFGATAKTLQDALARSMRTSTNAKDCVFAAVRAVAVTGGENHVTLLKLDAIVEAAQMRWIAKKGISFEVLKELLPEPGKLQKALSWPDPRPSSDVIMLDTNFAAAQYFEIAYQVQVSPKSVEAEDRLLRILSSKLPSTELPRAVDEAAALSGPLDEVLSTLVESHPELAGAAAEVSADSRPAGIVRANKIAARHVIWKAEGLEVRASPSLVPNVTKIRTPRGTWTLTIETSDEPIVQR
jgi:hypothetical protein